MRGQLFESELERVARTLTDQFGVQVICQGDEAWTDGRQIVLPSLPEPMDHRLERMVLGYLDHEMAHVAFSDFKVVKEFSEKHPGHEAMLNVVEDALIEMRAMQRWPGVRANLDAMFAQIRGRVRALAAQRDAFGRFCTAVYLKLAHYGDMLGMEAEVLGYEDLLDEFPRVRNTQDSAELAGRLLDRWRAKHPPAPAQQSSPYGEGDQDTGETHADSPQAHGHSPHDSASESSSSRNGPMEDEGDGSQPERGDSGDYPSTGSEASRGKEPDKDAMSSPAHVSAPAASKDDGDGHGVQCAQGAGGTSVITQALAEAIAEQAAQLAGGDEYRVFTKQFDRMSVVTVANDHDVQQMLVEHGDVVRRLRRGLANALRSAEKRWWRGDQLRGELSPRGLHRLCLDRPQLDVFRTQAFVQGRATAVSILLDASGSMTTNKMDVARDALRVLLQALDELKVATEALTFTTGNDSNVMKLATERGGDPNVLRQRFSRIANLEIGVVKPFGESTRLALRRLPSIKGTGLTPLGEAMQIAARRIKPRPENRKILLVVTDGRAGCEGNDGSAMKHAHYVARQIEAAGIELIGVGILDDSLRAIVADTIVVHQLEEMPAQLCKLLGRTLKKGLKHVG